MTIFDGAQLARGWLAVALASSTEKDIPLLYRTVAIEAFADGYRLVATDKVTLLTAWVPTLAAGPLTPEPELDELPDETVIAFDEHGRGKGFLGHVLALSKPDGPDDPVKEIEVAVRLGVAGDPDLEPATLAGFEASYVEFDLEDSETVRLVAQDGLFPTWRALRHAFKPKRTEWVALAPDVAGRLAKLGKIQPGTRLGFSWSGPKTAARLELIDSDPRVEGLVMPCAWDFDRNAPEVETEGTVKENLQKLADAGVTVTVTKGTRGGKG